MLRLPKVIEMRALPECPVWEVKLFLLGTVLLLGWSAPANENDSFSRLVLEAMDKALPRLPWIFFGDALFCAASGTTETVKRNGVLASDATQQQHLGLR